MTPRDRMNEPYQQSPASGDPPQGFDKPPAEPVKAPPAPREPQAPSAVSRAEVERLPAKYDNAPPDIQGQPTVASTDREEWGASPSFNDVKDVDLIEVRTKDPKSGGIYRGGAYVTAAGVKLQKADILARGENYLRSLLTDADVEARIAK